MIFSSRCHDSWAAPENLRKPSFVACSPRFVSHRNSVKLGLASGSCQWIHRFLVPLAWVLVKELNLSYHNKEAIFLTLDPCYGNLYKLNPFSNQMCQEVAPADERADAGKNHLWEKNSASRKQGGRVQEAAGTRPASSVQHPA